MQPVIVPPGVGRDFGSGLLCRVASASTGGALCAFEVTLAPGEGVPLHVHAGDDELYSILEGRLHLQCGDQTFSAEPGAMVFVPRTIPHAFANRTGTTTRFLNVFLPGGFDDLVAELQQIAPDDPDAGAKRDAIRARHGVTFLPR
jgi:quercetin dioxygenase-like cupin family protein